jgi:thiamine biosynthesis lipoprotein
MIRNFFFGLMVVLALTSCHRPVRFTGEAQGTYYAVTYYDPRNRDYGKEIDSLLAAVDRSVSRYQPGSIISRINDNDTTVRVDSIFADIFRKAMEVSEATQGAFDVTVGPLVNAWGFGVKPVMRVDTSAIDSLRRMVNYRGVHLENGRVVKQDPHMTIDFDAIAQGYTVDLIGAFLEHQGITSYIIDVGGEVLARGIKPGGEKWHVGIERPAQNQQDERQVKAVIAVKDEALSTSGNYRKYYEVNGIRYSHTIDPATGYPVTHPLLSVTVMAGDCATADAYATAFMVMGLAKAKAFLEKHPELNGYFIYSGPGGQTKTYMTEGIKKILVEED